MGINFDGFQMVVDKLDGIDITLTQDEADYMELWGFAMEEGVNHMNGEEALAYARSRYVGTGKEANDFGRTYRQRVVVTHVFKELMNRRSHRSWTILDSIMDCVETDITNSRHQALDRGLQHGHRRSAELSSAPGRRVHR